MLKCDLGSVNSGNLVCKVSYAGMYNCNTKGLSRICATLS
ncbi:hypothetical protein HORM4_240015 [Vibrio harveyi]|nr:hypothetical protein HORM4_240015 [Vibrio harveyi]